MYLLISPKKPGLLNLKELVSYTLMLLKMILLVFCFQDCIMSSKQVIAIFSLGSSGLEAISSIFLHFVFGLS